MFDFSDTTYEFVANIGQGAFGVVCQALDHSTNPPSLVAIKRISLMAYIQQPAMMKRVYREIKIMASAIHCDHVMPLSDAFTKTAPANVGSMLAAAISGTPFENDVYLVMEYMDTDLATVLYGQPRQALTFRHIKLDNFFPLPFIYFMTFFLSRFFSRYFTYQLLLGLHYLHSANPPVIHRDLKPHNLLVNRRGRLKIADFGLSREWTSFNMTRQVVALAYRAPELVLQLPNYTEVIDLWSVGCIVAEMISRRILFEARNEIQLVVMLINYFGRPPSVILNQIPNEAQFLRNFLMKESQNFNNQNDSVEAYMSMLVDKFLPNPEFELSPDQAQLEGPTMKDFLSKLLAYVPDERLTACDALQHQFLNSPETPYFEPVPMELGSDFEQNLAEMPVNLLVENIKEEIYKVSHSAGSGH